MPNGKPDPGCKDCNGTGRVVLFTSSKICDCVNRKLSFTDAIGAIKKFRDFEHYIPNVIKRLQLSADYIADGIVTWCMWPGIEGHTCDGCGAEMNVLGMSYNHWCPLCDPEGKEHVYSSMSRYGLMPFDYPVFGPSIDTIRAGVRLADTRRKERDRRTVRNDDVASDGKTG